MNHRKVQGAPVDLGTQVKDAAPGSFFVSDSGSGLRDRCPCGCGTVGFLPFTGSVPPGATTWHWDGNRERPTLTPSVRRITGCRWHGHLVAGVWRPCKDSGRAA